MVFLCTHTHTHTHIHAYLHKHSYQTHINIRTSTHVHKHYSIKMYIYIHIQNMLTQKYTLTKVHVGTKTQIAHLSFTKAHIFRDTTIHTYAYTYTKHRYTQYTHIDTHIKNKHSNASTYVECRYIQKRTHLNAYIPTHTFTNTPNHMHIFAMQISKVKGVEGGRGRGQRNIALPSSPVLR